MIFSPDAFDTAWERWRPPACCLLARLAVDLTGQFGRGFSERNLGSCVCFISCGEIPPTLSAKSPDAVPADPGIAPTASAKSGLAAGIGPEALEADAASLRSPARFPLPWSHYVRLLSVDNPEARAFYEHEALRGGWSARQLDRQISTLFYDRTLLSRQKAAMLKIGRSRNGRGGYAGGRNQGPPGSGVFSASKTSTPNQRWKRR